MPYSIQGSLFSVCGLACAECISCTVVVRDTADVRIMLFLMHLLQGAPDDMFADCVIVPVEVSA